jgi:hypothetical protein
MPICFPAFRFCRDALFTGGMVLALMATPLWARHKTTPDKQDQIEVVGRLPVDGGSISRLVLTTHEGTRILYAEHPASHRLTLIDVGDLRHPSVLATTPVAGGNSESHIISAAGNAALVSTAAEPLSPVQPQTVSIVDFSDRAKPHVVQKIDGVTSMASDDGRGLVFLAAGNEVWILHKKQAPDPAVERFFEHDILGNH